MEEPFKKALPIIEKLNEAGFEAYFVGGSVRDFLLKRPIGDIDIATSALPEDVQRLFERTIPVGIKHGTVVVVFHNECYEVTTFRIDGDYQDFRRPSKVEFVSTLEQDLSRRDFTINAIAMDKNGAIIDPFKGKEDLINKYIQTVGNPDERLLEDPLRIMRALRFVGQLDFELSIDTKLSIKKNAAYLAKISIERVLIEFEKLLNGKARKKALDLIAELHIFNYLPELECKQEELLQFAEASSTQSLTVDEQWTLLLIMLKVKNIEHFFKQWKSSNERIKFCKLYLNAIEELEKKHGLTPLLVYTYGIEVLQSCIKLYCILENIHSEALVASLQDIHHELPIFSRRELAVTGNDLMDWFQKTGGPWLSETIGLIERAVVNGELSNTKDEIKEWLLRCNPQFENNY